MTKLSLCYDFQKWTIISLASIAISLSVGLVLIAHGQTTNKPDFMMDMSTVSTRDDELTLFAINDKSYREMCPSGNCTFEIDHLIGPHFTPPNPETMRMWGSFHFKLKDKVDNPNIGEKEQEFLEKFDVLFSCKVEDIIEDNGQEIYTCHDTSIVNREFDSKTWDYNTVVKFDAKNETVKVYGNYAGVDRW